MNLSPTPTLMAFAWSGLSPESRTAHQGSRARALAHMGRTPGLLDNPPPPGRPPGLRALLARWLARLLARLLVLLVVWSWRHRRPLTPYGIASALLLATSTGHMFAPQDWPLAGLGVAGLAALIALRRDRLAWRAYLIGSGAAASGWTALTWASGASDPMVVALGVGGTLLGVPWWWRIVRLRSEVEVEWSDLGELWAEGRLPFAWRIVPTLLRDLSRWARARRRLQGYRRDWPLVSLQAGGGLLNSEIQTGRFTDHVDILGIELEGGRHVDGIVIPELESALDVAHGLVKVRGGRTARRCTIEIVSETEPVPERLLWTGPEATSVFEPVPLGEWAGGRQVRLVLVHPDGEDRGKVTGHVAVGGMTGWGKSALVRRVLDHLTTCPDAEVWAIDPKGGVDMQHWRPMLRELVTSARDAVRLLQRVQGEAERRRAELVRRGDDNWMQREGDRLLVLIVDELAELPAAAKELLDSIVRMGRATGILVIALTQRWSAASTGKEGTGDLRSQFASRICFFVGKAVDADMLFDDGMGRQGWRPDRFTVKGRALIHSTVMGYTAPEPWQCYWVPGGRALRELVARRCGEPAAAEAPRDAEAADQRPDAVADEGRGDPRQRVREALARAGETGLSIRELVREVGLGSSQTYRHLSRLMEVGEVEKPPDTSRYRLLDPGAAPDLADEPMVRLRELLGQAPIEGIKVEVLVNELDGIRSRSWVFEKVRELTRSGEVLHTGRSRYRLAESARLAVVPVEPR